VPSAKIIALLVNPTNFNTDALLKSLQPAARTFGLQVHVVEASTEGDFDTAFATLHELRADGLVSVGDVFLISRSKELAFDAVDGPSPARECHRRGAC
jgi:putative ABC transport system substrate-binding protein